MFAFIVNNEFMGLWANKIGDIFFENTCKGMKWNKELTSLIYFQDFPLHNSENNMFEFENNMLVFYEVIKNEQGEIVGKGNKESEITGEFFVSNGLMSRAC